VSRTSSSVRSLDSAYADFLRAPSSHEGLANESYIESVVGHLSASDRGGQYDAAKEKYEKPARTFRQAFNLCFPAKRGSHGKRSWEDFDLETLRECGFPDLELPAGAHEAMSREEERYVAAREDEARRELGYDAPEPEYLEPVGVGEYDAPPLALRTFPGPAPRGGRDFRERARATPIRTTSRGVRTKKSGARPARESRRSERTSRKKSGKKVSSTASVLKWLEERFAKRRGKRS
jgi:hypothetical protein